MQKYDAFRSRRLLDSARGQSCQNCDADDGTIVAAHSNSAEHGKGKSIKAADCFVAYLCFRCHGWLDQGTGADPTGIWSDSEGDKKEMWRKANDRTLHLMFKQGIVKVA